MEVAHFERAAEAAAGPIADPSLSVGKRILRATEASFAATGLNTNLGIVLLCAPLAKAASETTFGIGLAPQARRDPRLSRRTGRRRRLCRDPHRQPAGLGKVDRGDVREGVRAPHIDHGHASRGRARPHRQRLRHRVCGYIRFCSAGVQGSARSNRLIAISRLRRCTWRCWRNFSTRTLFASMGKVPPK